MLNPPKPNYGLIDEVLSLSPQRVMQLWGSPLIIDLDDQLYFEPYGDGSVLLDVHDSEGNKRYDEKIQLDCIAGQLCTTLDEVDLVFRLVEGTADEKSQQAAKWLVFDQDHDDNGAPGNGGGTGTGSVRRR